MKKRPSKNPSAVLIITLPVPEVRTLVDSLVTRIILCGIQVFLLGLVSLPALKNKFALAPII